MYVLALQYLYTVQQQTYNTGSIVYLSCFFLRIFLYYQLKKAPQSRNVLLNLTPEVFEYILWKKLSLVVNSM